MQAQPLASVSELADRLPFVLNADETREAVGALIDLSDEARRLGSRTWIDPTVTPSQIRNLVLRAATRHMKNPEGLIQSRAGDETLAWSDPGAEGGSATFTEGEQRAIRMTVRGSGGFSSVPFAFDQPHTGRLNLDGYVPVEGGGDPFPFYASSEPW